MAVKGLVGRLLKVMGDLLKVEGGVIKGVAGTFTFDLLALMGLAVIGGNRGTRKTEVTAEYAETWRFRNARRGG